MYWKDIEIGEKAFLPLQQLAIEKIHRIAGITVSCPDSQLDAGVEHTIGPLVPVKKLKE